MQKRTVIAVVLLVIVAVAVTSVLAARRLGEPNANNAPECVVQDLKSSPGASVTIRITPGALDGQLFVDLYRPGQPEVELATMGLDFDLAQVVATYIGAADRTEILEMVIRGEGSPASEDVVRWVSNSEASVASTRCKIGGFVVDYVVSDQAIDIEFGNHQVKVPPAQNGGVFTYVGFSSPQILAVREDL